MRRANVVGALLISSQIKSQLFAMNKGGQWGNHPPPQGPDGQRSELPLTPPALALSDRGCACSGRDRPPSVILICSLHAERVITWSQTTCGIRAFIFRCFTQDCEHHTGHTLKQHSTVIYRSSLAFNEECNLWGTKQEEWKRLDVVRPDWFDCNYDKQPNTSSALSYLIWLIWSLFQHRAPGNCNSQTCKWGACVAPTYSILDLLLRISSVNSAWSILHWNDSLDDDLFCSMTVPAQSGPALTTQNLLICSSGDIPIISLHKCEEGGL